MPDKRPRADSYLDAIDLVFEHLFAITHSSKPADSVTWNILQEFKRQLLSEEAEEMESTRKAAEEFTLEEAIKKFGLRYNFTVEDTESYSWKIEALPDVKTFQPSTCLVSFLSNCVRMYDRSNEAGCRVATNFLLCECIAVMRGTPHTLIPWDAVKVHCQVPFTHTINRMPRTPKTTPKTIVDDHVDYGVGIVTRTGMKAPNRVFHSLLLCVGAKLPGRLGDAFVELVVYLACLRQSRLNRGQSNTSVYGVVTDGLLYRFVTITHEGVVKDSRLFDVNQGDLSTILGCLQYVLETAMSMYPNLTPERGPLEEGDELEANGDDPFDVDDTPHPDSDDEEYSD